MRKPAITLLLTITISGVMPAQEALDPNQDDPRSAQLAMLARSDRDSVVLRWAVSKPGGWIVANRFGYVVERVRVNADGSVGRNAFERLTPEPLLPWPLEVWKRRAGPSNNYAAVAAQAIHGKVFIPRALEEGTVNALRNAADELLNRWSFALFAADNDQVAAEGLALRLTDRDVSEGDRYLYRVFAAGVDTTYALDTGFVLVTVAAHEPMPPPFNMKAEGLDRSIRLDWENPPGREYSGFYIYRSEDRGRTYRKMNQTPLVILTANETGGDATPRFTDTSVVNYRSYRYQVRGVTPFAELSSPAEVEVFGRDLTPPPAPQVRRPVQLGARTVSLEWDMPTQTDDLSGFMIARSANSLDGYVDLVAGPLPKSARRFIDTTATELEPYYIVGAVDTAGNVAPSLPVFSILIDTLPPSVPTGLAGSIDTNGVVRLRWNLGPEPGIIGYRVLWANDPSHEFSQRTPTPVKDTAFVDTVNVRTLTNYIYYRIAAVNNRFAHSEVSPILALRRPDKIAPEPPVFTDFLATDSSVYLTWAASRSADLKSQHIYRRVGRAGRWTMLASFGPAEQSYTDRAVSKGTTYEYMLEAVDSSGLRSTPAQTLSARPYDPGVRPTVQGLQGRYDSRKGTIELRWSYSVPLKEGFWFLIYRAKDGAGLNRHQSVGQNARSFTDKELVGKGRYVYAIRVFTDTGGESPMSEKVTVEVR